MSSPQLAALNSTPTTYQFWGYQVPYPPPPGANGGYLPAPYYPAKPGILQTSYLYMFVQKYEGYDGGDVISVADIPAKLPLVALALWAPLANFPSTFRVAKAVADISPPVGFVAVYRTITASYQWQQQFARSVPSNADPETAQVTVTYGVTTTSSSTQAFAATLGVDVGASLGPVTAEVSVAFEWSTSQSDEVSMTSETSVTVPVTANPGYTTQAWSVIMIITSEAAPTLGQGGTVVQQPTQTLTYADDQVFPFETLNS